MCNNENVLVIKKPCKSATRTTKQDKELEMYQKLFNETLSKLRLILIATGNQDLMKATAKIMFDFSDDLKENNLIKDEEQKYDNENNKF